MFKAYKKFWQKALKFDGYSSRSDYWWVFLINTIIFGILWVVRSMVSIPVVAKIMEDSKSLSQTELLAKAQDLSRHPSGSVLIVAIVFSVIGLAIIIPNVALITRRLRDAKMPTFIAILYGLGAFYGVFAGYLSGSFVSVLSAFMSLITLVTYVLCLFPSKYSDDEDDDSRNYD
ncbi:DUF805 domain-containing protein [Lactococcus sp.]|uniref:DUF805 domain-containing protein n=1 Tax=Lactococcus sp. TaxID=44273 RepID=UPI0035AEE4EA